MSSELMILMISLSAEIANCETLLKLLSALFYSYVMLHFVTCVVYSSAES